MMGGSERMESCGDLSDTFLPLWQAQQLCKATSGVENLTYLQDQGDLWGPVFACFLGTLPPNREVTISLCYVQELTLQPDGAAQFCWPRELFPSRKYISE